MNWELFAAFIAVSTIIIVAPGPNVTLIVATATLRGTTAGLLTVAGTSVAQAVQLVGVFAGLAWLVSAYGTAFDVIRVVGGVYLIWLGWQTFREAGEDTKPETRRSGNVQRGFLVALANPKTLTFYAAFLPQFIDPALPSGFQLFVLAVTYLVIATFFDCIYAFAGGYGRRVINSETAKLWLGRLSGTVLAAGGAWLVLMRRSTP